MKKWNNNKEKILIKATNLHKNYKMDKTIVKALKGVDLEIRKKDFIIIIGPSGSGKSTLLHLLSALDRPNKGKLLIDGHEINELDDHELSLLRRKKFGFIFQTFNLIPTLTALENVIIPLEPTKVNEEDAIDKANELLELVGLKNRINHKPGELSGGQRQRVAIARALINDPEIIFADEPTGNLDSSTGKHVIEIMKHLNKKENKTFVVVTHDESLLDFASKIFHLKDGKIMEKNGKIRKKYISKWITNNKKK